MKFPVHYLLPQQPDESDADFQKREQEFIDAVKADEALARANREWYEQAIGKRL
jgi:hypothetical protein